MNNLYIDVETTGIDHKECGIIELSYIVDDKDHNILAEGTLNINPLSYKPKVYKKALEVNGFTSDQFKGFQSAIEGKREFYNQIRPYMGGDKFKVFAYNAKFDTAFLQELFALSSDTPYYKVFDYKYIDPFELIKIYQHIGKIDTGKSQGLESAAKFFKIPHVTHNSKSDIEATRELWIKLEEGLK